MQRQHFVTAWGTASLLALGALGVASAQPEDAASGGSDAEQAAPQTPEQRLERAHAVSDRASQLVRSIGSMLDEAREAGDIIRVTCLNDKLAQGNATSSTVQERQGFLQEAVTEGDEGRSEHESTMIQVLDQKLDVLEAEATQCVGQDLFETGETLVTVEIDPNNPTEDPAVLPEVPSFPIPYIPPPASGVI